MEEPKFKRKSQKEAWQDEDDENVEVDLSKVARLRKLRKQDDESKVSGVEYQKRLQDFYQKKLKNLAFYGWGEKKQDDLSEVNTKVDEDEQDFMNKLQRTEFQYYKGNRNLGENQILIEKFGTMNLKDKHDAVVQSVDFHSNSQIFLSSGLDKLVKIFQINENKDSDFKKRIKLSKSVYLDGLPINCSRFLSEQNQIISSGMKKHLLVYDLKSDKIDRISSNLFTNKFHKQINSFGLSPNEDYISLYNEDGNIMILSGKTKQFLFEFKMNEQCRATAFSPDSKFLYTSGQGKIYQWDLNKRQIFDVVEDSGNFQNTCLSASLDGRYISTGSLAGVANIYGIDPKTNKIDQEPIKEIQNLTTHIDNICFNQQSELLAISSKWKKNQIRLVHLPTCTVYQNWPNFKTNLQFITCQTFSKNSKYLLLGNDSGAINLYNLAHYNN